MKENVLLMELEDCKLEDRNFFDDIINDHKLNVIRRYKDLHLIKNEKCDLAEKLIGSLRITNKHLNIIYNRYNSVFSDLIYSSVLWFFMLLFFMLSFGSTGILIGSVLFYFLISSSLHDLKISYNLLEEMKNKAIKEVVNL